MILGVSELLRLVREIKLVENLSERELTNPEGAGFDLRLGKLFRLKGKGFLGVAERETPEVELAAEYDSAKKESVTIRPGEYYLTETIERLNVPLNLLVIAKPRTTLHRSGIITRVSVADPGYSGTLHPAIYNAGGVPVEIELGARYINIMFFEIKGEAAAYRGQWQGGRATTDGRETQV
ncbi:MAG: Deoxycytidine deaminase [Parcubacteria group bacterium GW2011_GWB1_52_7]|nr:MAG: Deoxycytidine deaminase [Parcubacteria group bacterium GW2011_GWA1_51_12]KKW28332.1 MAG: Deoxycytidine deaminase [Parcubacteria group bacterium GW2011_GWB1_52_7]KKW30197.1 MAG: Deoxycytidine deaminase [Parcubacteria group bacterium GW2011_GWC2_52_8c]